MEKDKDLRSKFLKAIEDDSPVTKLWKYRTFIQTNPQDASSLKEKMLELALKHKLVGEYEMIHKLLGVELTGISRSGEYGRIKDEVIPALNNLKIEA